MRTDHVDSPLKLNFEARKIAINLREHFPAEQEELRQVIALAEEVGEFVGAYRRYAGMARRQGMWPDVTSELADVVITAYVTAEVMGINLEDVIVEKLKKIYERGWKE